MKKKANANKLKLKPIFLAFAVMSTTSVLSFAACTTDEPNEDDTPVTKTDTQLIKNGNFEFYNENEDDDDEGVYYISNVNSWSSTSLGTPSSDVMSGIISTNKSVWAEFTATDLAAKLDTNNALDSDDDDYENNYLDFNGLESWDLPFKDAASVIPDDEDDEGAYNYVTPEESFIANPGDIIYTNNGDEGYYDMSGKFVKLYKKDGVYYTDSEYTEEYNNHVLMLHNYTYSHKDSNEDVIHNGTAQKYSSSTTVTLEANTAAEISVWVKTSNLIFNNGENVHQNRGAFIEVAHTVGGTALDSMLIKNINTEKLLANGVEGDNNGWYKYTVYVQACDFASTTVTISLGLGESGANNYVEGYAFFDDLTMTKYTGLDKTSYSNDKVKNSTCTLTDEADEKQFIADKLVNGENAPDERNSKDFYYLLDLTASNERTDASASNVSYEVGLTVDSNKYSSSESLPASLYDITASNKVGTFLPKFEIETANDVLAKINLSGNADAVTSTVNSVLSSNKYSDKIISAVSSATGLPGVDSSNGTDTVILLSANGAAYTSTIAGNSNSSIFTVEADSYKIVSFWVKTSDMNGKTAATLAIYDADDDDNKKSFTIDTSDITFDLDDDNEDVYNGWAQCFFFVQNDTDKDKSFNIDFSFGNTSIKDTTVASYQYGYAMLTNLQTFDVDEDEFDLIGSNSYSATLTFSDSDETVINKFDEAYTNLAEDLKETVAAPASYDSVLGSTKIGKDSVTYTSGLVSKENFADVYAAYSADKENEKYEWLSVLEDNDHFAAIKTAEEVWESLFGSKSVQPLLVVNTIKTVYEETAINRGYVASSATLSTSECVAVSVKVKVSAGAVAYIYLTNGGEVISYTTPDYTFWYDDEGNVLYEEPGTDSDYDAKANIAYRIRTDGLYESIDENDGNLYANIYNYEKRYVDQSVGYYDENGNEVLVDNIYGKNVDELYYDENGKVIEHYLVASDGRRLYKWNAEEQAYYYNEANEYTKKVLGFNTDYARYNAENAVDEQYLIVVDGNDESVVGKWVTVSFYLSAGSEAKDYTLELWNGERYVTGLNADGNVDNSTKNGVATSSVEGSYIVFDYSVSTMDSSTFTSFIDNKESAIKDQYKNAIINAIAGGAEIELDKNEDSIEYYKQIAEDNSIAVTDQYNYNAIYHTYSLYDSTNFVPFNEGVESEDSTNYDYAASNYSEALSYLYLEENVVALDGSEEKAYSMFVDYSTVDQTVSREVIDDVDEDEEVIDTDNDDTSVWLLASSILLVVALVIALCSMLLKDVFKKAAIKLRSRKTYKNNKYDAARKRYIRKLKLTDESELVEEQVKSETNDSTEEHDGAEATDGEVTESEENEELKEDSNSSDGE